MLSRKHSAQEWLRRDSDGWYYTIVDTPPFRLLRSPLPHDSHVRLIHDAGDASAIWTFGDAFLKVNLVQDTKTATGKHDTLSWLAGYKLSLAIPSVLYHAQDDDRRYLIVSRFPGTTLDEAWGSLSDGEKEHYVQRIADIRVELSGWHSDAMTGDDGAQLFDNWLDPCRTPHDFVLRRSKETASNWAWSAPPSSLVISILVRLISWLARISRSGLSTGRWPAFFPRVD